MIRSEGSYLNITIRAVRQFSRRHNPTDARLAVEELASIALNTEKPKLRIKAMRALNEASTTRNPGARFAAMDFLDPSVEAEASMGALETPEAAEDRDEEATAEAAATPSDAAPLKETGGRGRD